MGDSHAVAALREQFGDRPPPEITRKITACVACRKQKIKCIMREDGQPPCVRCRKRGLSCTVNKSLQMILESDASWKERMERKLHLLGAGLAKVAGHLSLSDVMEIDEDDEPAETASPPAQMRVYSNQGHHSPHNFEIIMDPESGPAAIPGSVVSPVILPGLEPQDRSEQDIIVREVVTLQRAQNYLDVYQNRLDHFLYRIIGDRRTLAEVRAASPLLLAAICAVGSLHSASTDFQECYQEFVTIAAAQTFSRRNNVDDVRGLCVAAFWLSGITWICTGAAVRIATEIQLHRSIFKALSGDRDHYLRTRLFYLVYVCDHQSSIAYGRPPMTSSCDAIRDATRFLDTEHADEDDARLISQVHFWTVLSEIYEVFGVDVDRPLNATMIEPLRRFSIRLDGIRADWTERFSRNHYVGNYPRKGVGLHYHFAKLYLFSMAFRGIGRPGFKDAEIALDIDELANAALLSATSILRAVVTDAEIQGYLNGLPTYFDVMIAFAVVFVLKVSTKYSTSVRVDTSEIRSLVGQLVSVLQKITAAMHPRHLLVSVARGAARLLEKCSELERCGPVPSNAHVVMSQPAFDDTFFDMSATWDGTTWENFDMGEFDFLSSQDARGGHFLGNHALPPT